MKYIFKPKNRIECISRNGEYHGFFTIKNIELVISAKNPRHLQVLMKFRHKTTHINYIIFFIFQKYL